MAAASGTVAQKNQTRENFRIHFEILNSEPLLRETFIFCMLTYIIVSIKESWFNADSLRNTEFITSVKEIFIHCMSTYIIISIKESWWNADSLRNTEFWTSVKETFMYCMSTYIIIVIQG